MSTAHGPTREFLVQRIARPLADASWLPYSHVGVLLRALDGKPFQIADEWVTEKVLHLAKADGKPHLVLHSVDEFRGTAKVEEVELTGKQFTLTAEELDRRAQVADSEVEGKDYEIIMRDCECVVSRILHNDERHVPFFATLAVLAGGLGLWLFAKRAA